MTIYVDECTLKFRGKLWSHMVADSLDELHAFAERLRLKREWFQHRTLYPHYDVTQSVRAKAVELGAQICDKRTVVSKAKALRFELNALHRAQSAAGPVSEASTDDNSPQLAAVPA